MIVYLLLQQLIIIVKLQDELFITCILWREFQSKNIRIRHHYKGVHS